MKKRLFCIFCVGLLLSIGTSWTEESAKEKGKPVSTDLKIRVVDSYALMRETEEGMETAQSLQEKGKKYTEVIQDEQKKIERKVGELKGKESMLSATAREKEQQNLLKEERELKNKVQEYEEDYKLAARTAEEEITRSIVDSASAVSEADEIDILEDRSGHILYASSKADYTLKMKDHMNKKHEAKKKNKKSTQA